jgi:hypothetical protein
VGVRDAPVFFPTNNMVTNNPIRSHYAYTIDRLDKTGEIVGGAFSGPINFPPMGIAYAHTFEYFIVRGGRSDRLMLSSQEGHAAEARPRTAV